VVRRILAAVDTSPRAPRVVETAAKLAKQFDAELVIFRAVDVPQDFPPAAATSGDAVEPKILADAERELAALAAAENAKATVRVVASHEAWRAIVEEADALHADTIVIGSHGYHGLDRIVGTNAARVADRAHCLVVVVHEPPE
jgi:nucleotide-binding universal stress UspA family protein